ncbi:MAG: hypothetical protein ABSC05_39165 [Candidatus Solibacter sp.]|jgi:hypothetical protein
MLAPAIKTWLHYLSWDQIWSKVVVSLISTIFLALIGHAFHWWSAIWTFLLGTLLVQRWLLGVLVLGDLALVVDLARKRRKTRWFTWNELDWQLLGEFFAEGHGLKPDLAENLSLYIRGPFCRNPSCKREVRFVDAERPGGFFNSIVVCPYCQNSSSFNLGRRITETSEERAVLVEACKEAQAASRRGERFRASQ